MRVEKEDLEPLEAEGYKQKLFMWLSDPMVMEREEDDYRPEHIAFSDKGVLRMTKIVFIVSFLTLSITTGLMNGFTSKFPPTGFNSGRAIILTGLFTVLYFRLRWTMIKTIEDKFNLYYENQRIEKVMQVVN